MRKQTEVIENTIKSRNQELEDEKVESFEGINGEGCAGIIQFEEILPFIDSIKRIVFQGAKLKENKYTSKIYVVFKKSLNLAEAFGEQIFLGKDYVEISLKKHFSHDSELKRLLDTIDIRVPENTKAGFCHNLFPKSGLWLVH